ncbi:hypothetical protein [Furfurilactobacillus siliginis]|uniref:Uncharacterized protein n=1 Tax=Furfurilactobacillus siliginis TaxID=348151 RepID=A0A0R2L9Q6_9LACO|nr:hypothetical protein [Furfurilactobacillus siliginis]KRN96454.1 hypothetical protein IV55_GL001426 [Furfurilactobacillus siliginis]GEK28914.1 hypothetical protein LSI01_12250 [Furfurilactobacillus siliginis]
MDKALKDTLGFLIAGLGLLIFGIWARQLATGAFGTVLLLIGLYNLWNRRHQG